MLSNLTSAGQSVRAIHVEYRWIDGGFLKVGMVTIVWTREKPIVD